FFARRGIFFGEFDKTGFFWFRMFGMFAGMFDICHLSSYGARRTAHGARLSPLAKRLLPSLP
ncbi:MAG: hypothetical protein ACR2P4_00365, partial [Gammaproteobacteria bacterium]